MPLHTWDTIDDWNDAYSFGAEGAFPDGHPNTRKEVKLHYHKSARGGIVQRIADHFTTYLTPANFNRRFVIVGGGFGWVGGALVQNGFTNVVCVDTSLYIQAEKDNDDEAEIRAEIAKVGLDPDSGRGSLILAALKTPGPRRGTILILDEDISTTAGRNAIKSEVNGNPQIIVSESVMESLTDAEAIQLDADMNAFGGQQKTAHMVYVLADDPATQDPDYNWKSLANWAALIPGATWIDARTGEVLE